MLCSLAARVVLLTSFGVALFVARMGRVFSRRRHAPARCIVATGTFYSRNWFLSHAVPLSQSGVDNVVFVADEPQAGVAGLHFACPPRWVSKLLGRALSKFIWMVVAGFRYRPDLYMGFHIFPGALTALIVSRLFGRPACYQMTGGPIEVIGGGFSAENPVMKLLDGASKRLERWALSVVREFDLVVVRGRRAAEYLASHGVARVAVITGSVEVPPIAEPRGRPIEMVFVGRLTEIKQPEQFLEIAARVKEHRRDLRAVVVGDGPELPRLGDLSVARDLADNVSFLGQLDNVAEILKQSKVFVLTSRSEGLSISMLEAMAWGVPVVAADVGELGDLVVNGQTGWLVHPGAIDDYRRRIVELLDDEDLRCRLSSNARVAAKAAASRENVAARWRKVFARVLPQGGPERGCSSKGH